MNEAGDLWNAKEFTNKGPRCETRNVIPKGLYVTTMLFGQVLRPWSPLPTAPRIGVAIKAKSLTTIEALELEKYRILPRPFRFNFVKRRAERDGSWKRIKNVVVDRPMNALKKTRKVVRVR